tara:strand:+ start:7039 stop:7482 length:444 start_codon:yes stop_codon:yes gene_type:complete
LSTHGKKDMGLFKDCGCGCNGSKQQEKFITSIISGLTFFVVANPETFRLVRRILGPRIATPNGCPSTVGLLIHALVFVMIVWGMMNVRKDLPKVKDIGPSAGCSDCKEGVVPPKKQIDVVMKPGMVDEPFVDTGLELGSMDLNPTLL